MVTQLDGGLSTKNEKIAIAEAHRSDRGASFTSDEENRPGHGCTACVAGVPYNRLPVIAKHRKPQIEKSCTFPTSFCY